MSDVVRSVVCLVICMTPLSEVAADEPTSSSPAGITRLARLFEANNISIDMKRRIVTIEGEVCMHEGAPAIAGPGSPFIEVLACSKDTKEYESLISCKTRGTALAAALLVIGATGPSKDRPGTAIGVTLHWRSDGKRRFLPAQDWVINAADSKPHRGVWRFNPPKGHTDELINTSNGSGVLNLDPDPVANTAIPTTLPPKGTRIRIELKPLTTPAG